MNAPFPLTRTDRFALIISGLHAAVAARIRCPPVTAEIIVFVCARLRRIGAEFANSPRRSGRGRMSPGGPGSVGPGTRGRGAACRL